MRLEQLYYLVETAKNSSINKAGEHLHITHQSLNTALKKLEDELDVELFHRNYNGITLTEQGKLAVAYAEEILQKIDAMQQAVAESSATNVQPELSGELVLYASPSALHALIPKAAQRLMQEYPQIRLTLLEKDNRDMVQSIMQKVPCACIPTVIDALNGDFMLLDRKKVFYQKIADAKMYVSVAANHPLAKQKSVAAHTLLKYPLAIYQLDDSTSYYINAWLDEKGTPNIRLKTNNLRVYQRAVNTGRCIGFLPRVMCKEGIDARDGVEYLPVRDFPPFETVLAMDWDYYYENEALILALLDCIVEAVEN